MQCPKCGSEIPEGKLYCEKCGEEIQMVPDYDPLLDVKLGDAAEEAKQDKPSKNGSPKERETLAAPSKRETEGKKIRLFLMRGILVLLAITVIVLIFLVKREVKRLQSLEYQIENAEKCRELGNYAKALEYYARALELDENNLELMEAMANVYYLKNDQAWYEAMLRRILAHPQVSEEQARKVTDKIITILIKKGDFDSISKMVRDSEDKELKETYKKYLSPAPSFSLEEGAYEVMQSLQILSDPDWEGKIYYTTDGSVPGEEANLYRLPIVLEEGKTTIRACFINAYGIKSEVITATYLIGNQ